MPTEYLKRLYFDSLVYTHPQLEYLVRQYGADHVLVGTDYPADMGEIDPIGFIEGAAVERRGTRGDPWAECGATAGDRGASSSEDLIDTLSLREQREAILSFAFAP